MDVAIWLKFGIYFILLGGPLFALIYFFLDKRKREKDNWFSSRTYKLLTILVPKNNEKSPLAAEQMFASLHGIFREDERYQEKISFEIATHNNFLQFYAYVPAHLKDFVEGQIYAQYPTVEIYESNDYAHDDLDGKKIVGTEILLSKSEVYPIKTFLNFEVDPLAAITSVISKVEDDTEMWVQIITKPVSDRWQLKGISHVSALKRGEKPGRSFFLVLLHGIFKFIVDLIKIAASGGESSATQGEAEVKLSGPVETALKAVETKATKLGFTTKIRLVAVSRDINKARMKIEEVTGALKQFSTTNLNSFERSRLVYEHSILDAYKKRLFNGKGYILNIEELASIFHLPTIAVETPNIVWAGSKKGEPPSNLPLEGSIQSKDITLFAKTDFRNIKQSFGIKNHDRRLHLYAIGKTGTGKSTLLENMIIDDIRNGRGVAVVDPHGDLINHVINFIPDSRVNDVIYFNPADRDYPIGFNPLESVDPDLKNIIASGVVGIFKKIFGESWGPRLEYILRNTILALLDYPNATLLGIMRMLTDKEFRKKVLETVHDPVIRDFFVNEYEKYDPKFRTEAIAPIQNKVGQFLSSSTIRNLVGQPKSSFDMHKVMDEGKILLIDLSIGRIGEDNSALLGAMMITKIQLSAMQRANMPEEKRRDFYLYVDEFQNFATESFAIILSEARKYHLNLILTNQYIAQMPEVVAKAIFGNVGTIVSFRVGATDASFLVKEFEPVFEANDMVNLNNYYIYIKMAIDGVTRPAFSAITLPPAKGEMENKEKIINISRERYAKSREVVEQKIIEWSEEARGHQPEKARSASVARTSSLEPDYRVVEDSHGQTWYILKNVTKEPVQETPKTPTAQTVEVKREASRFKPILAPIVDRKLKGQHHKPLISVHDVKTISKDNFKGSENLKAGESVKIK